VVSRDNENIGVQTQQIGKSLVEFLDCLDFALEVGILPAGIRVLEMNEEEVIFGIVTV
jgi:hypothetical protein